MPFQKGHKTPKPFSKSNQPKKNGRKKSRFEELFAQIGKTGAEPLSLEDYKKSIGYMLSLDVAEIEGICKNPDTPVSVLVIAKSLLGDIRAKKLDNIEKLADRVFGKAIQNMDVKQTSKYDFSELSEKEIEMLSKIAEKTIIENK